MRLMPKSAVLAIATVFLNMNTRILRHCSRRSASAKRVATCTDVGDLTRLDPSTVTPQQVFDAGAI